MSRATFLVIAPKTRAVPARVLVAWSATSAERLAIWPETAPSPTVVVAAVMVVVVVAMAVVVAIAVVAMAAKILELASLVADEATCHVIA